MEELRNRASSCIRRLVALRHTKPDLAGEVERMFDVSVPMCRWLVDGLCDPNVETGQLIAALEAELSHMEGLSCSP